MLTVALSKDGSSVLQAKKITAYLLFSSLWAKYISGVISLGFLGVNLKEVSSSLSPLSYYL